MGSWIAVLFGKILFNTIWKQLKINENDPNRNRCDARQGISSNLLEAFPSETTNRMSLEKFISRFTEDRLREEIEFVEEEIQHA